MQYFLQQKISTLADNYVALDLSGNPHFELDDVTYKQWDFNYGDGALGEAWIAEGSVDAGSGNEALAQFRKKIATAVPMISLISQCYMDFRRQPMLLKRSDTDFAFVSYIYDSAPVGLMFMDEQFAGLKTLSENASVPAEFYKYWNDAQNAIGYPPKLLLMFSAIEALVRKPSGKREKDIALLEQILGPELVEAIFAQRTGLRNRLVHGEYFNATDDGVDYLDLVHRKVVAYFNTLMGSEVITENVVQPQRHFYDNKLMNAFFLRPKDSAAPLQLREIVADLEANDHHLTRYDHVFDDPLTKNY